MKKCIRERCPRRHNTQFKECPNCLERGRRYRVSRREQVIKVYGGKCKCCGESKIEFLSIDHKQQHGAAHRRKVGTSHRFYGWLIRNNYPKQFQLLCNNCNQSLGNYGYCPHRPNIRRKVIKNAFTRLRIKS